MNEKNERIPLKNTGGTQGMKKMHAHFSKKVLSKKKNRYSSGGFTLLEVQIASLLMVIILVATGVIFYFALTSMRYMHDAYRVYYNAATAMRYITQQVMVSNCYGRAQNPNFPTPANSFYGSGGYQHSLPGGGLGQIAQNAEGWMPTLDGNGAAEWTSNGGGSGLFLRQARQPSSIRGINAAASTAGNFPEHDSLFIYRYQDPVSGRWQIQAKRDSPGSAGFGGGSDQVIAEFISELAFRPISYNCVAVRVRATGQIPSPMGGGGQIYEVSLAKAITLRCAPSRPMASDATFW